MKLGIFRKAAMLIGLSAIGAATSVAADPLVIKSNASRLVPSRKETAKERLHLEPAYYGSVIRLVVRPDMNQRQRRKHNRGKHAAGFRSAFA